MEVKKINFSTISNEPNDYQNTEGELSLSVNAVLHNGSMRVVENGLSTGIVLDKSETLMYIHTMPNTGEKRYIVLVDNNYSSGSGKRAPSRNREKITSKFTIEAYDDYCYLKGYTDSGTVGIRLTYEDGKTEDIYVTTDGSGMQKLDTELQANKLTDAAIIYVLGQQTNPITLTVNTHYSDSSESMDESTDESADDPDIDVTDTDESTGSDTDTDDTESVSYLFAIKWIDTSSTINGLYKRVTIKETDAKVMRITAVKNVLVVCTDIGILYARNTGDGYKWLGEFPKLPYIYPYLQTRVTDSMGEGISANSITATASNISDYVPSGGGTSMEFTDTNVYRQSLYEASFASLNALRAKLHRQGEFTSPFVVRFAYRMYDGSHASVSRPYIMCVSSSFKPLLIGNSIPTYDDNGNVINYKSRVKCVMPASTLGVCIGAIDQEWEDIIEGVDIFVSPEVAGYTDSVDGIKSVRVKDDDDEGSFFPFDSSYNTMSVSSPTLSNVYKNVESKSVYSNIGTASLGSLKSGGELTAKEGDVLRGCTFTFGSVQGWDIVVENELVSTACVYLIKNEDYENGCRILYVTKKQEIPPLSSYDTGVLGKLYQIIYAYDNTIFDNYKVIPPIYGKYGSKIVYYNGQNATIKKYVVYLVKEVTDTFSYQRAIDLKRADGVDPVKELMEMGTFYKLDSVKLRELTSEKLVVPDINENKLENLATQPMLQETSVRPYAVKTDDVFVYNNRLNAVVEEQMLETPDYMESFQAYDIDNINGERYDECYVNVVINGTAYQTKLPSSQNAKWYPEGANYFFYPSTNATRLFLVDSTSKKGSLDNYSTDFLDDEGNKLYLEFNAMGLGVCSVNEYRRCISYELTKHETLLGTYSFNNWETLTESSQKGLYVDYSFRYPTNDEIEERATLKDESGDVVPIEDYMPKIVSLIKGAVKTTLVECGVSGINFNLYEQGYTFSDIYTDGDSDIREFIKKLHYDSATQQTFKVGNKILLSEVDNPFVFLNAATCTIGCDEISKIMSCSQAISEGQFGDYPLYAFTNEGIFALSVGETGTYTSVRPLSQDVLTGNATALDQSLLFVTKRGLMLLEGGRVVCLCDQLKGHNYLDSLRNIDKVKSIAGVLPDEIGEHIEDWFATAEILYDYKRQLIYCFHEAVLEDYPDVTQNIGLVYSIEDKAWGMYENSLGYCVNSYTDALAVGEDANDSYCLINMSESLDKERESYNTLIVTRPMTLGYDDIHKTIESVLLKGVYDNELTYANGKVNDSNYMLVVWASNDLTHWGIIGSSTTERWRNHSGTPYKYFRIGVMAKMKEKDSINGVVVSFTPRLNNKIR